MTGPRPARRAGAALALVAACLALPGAGGRARGDEVPVRLAYHFREGEEVVMQVAHRAHSDTTINGVTQSTETATESKKRWRVVEVTPDGRATIEHSVDDVTMSSRTSDQGEVRWTSRGEETPPPGYEGVPESLGRPLSRVVIDGAGRVLSRTQLFPSPESASGDLMVVPLPDDPVGPGAEWTVPQELVVEVPGGPRRAVRTRLRYRLAEVRDGLARISVDTTVLTPVDDPRLEARLIERIWDGTIEFDVATGRVVSRSTGIDRRVVGFSGEQSSVRYRSQLEERLVDPADRPD